jgi:flagellin
MRVNTNIPALNAQRTLGGTSMAAAKNIGRLSSGFRINRAADDAAGLGIANKIRADLRAMRQASRNAEQATSLLQVAEGAVQTISGVLDRMKELAVQSASDNVNDTDRVLIQAEFAELKSEVARIVSTTKFQGKTLLNNSLGNSITGGTLDASVTGVQSLAISGTSTGTYTFSQASGAITVSDGNGLQQTLSGLAGGQQTLNFDLFGVSIETDASFGVGGGAADTVAGTVVVGGGNTKFVVSVSGAADTDDAVQLSALDVRDSTLGNAVKLNAWSLSLKADAVTAITNIDYAINQVSSAFGTIGAAQNRIEYATANVKTSIENFAAAESTIRDADMAAEMTEYSKNQILQQAGVAMLAQANTSAQLVLKLLG